MSQKKGTVSTETRLFSPQRETRKLKLEITTADTEGPCQTLNTLQSSYRLSHLLARVISQQAHRCSTSAGDGWIARR